MDKNSYKCEKCRSSVMLPLTDWVIKCYCSFCGKVTKHVRKA